MSAYNRKNSAFRAAMLIPICLALGWGVCMPAHACAAEPSPDSVAGQLRQLAADLSDARPLLDALGHDDYHQREQATQRLMRMPIKPVEALTAMAQGDDPEKKFRAAMILRQTSTSQAQLEQLLAALMRQRSPGLTKELLLIAAQGGGSQLQFTLQQALHTTMRPADIPLLKRTLASDDANLRAMAATALGHSQGPLAATAVLALADDPHDNVRLAVCGALARHQRPECVPLLAKLLLSDDKDVRSVAALTLHASTGRDFGYFRTRQARQRQAVADRWQSWYAEQGPQLKLRAIRQTVTTASPFD